jgi:hypothetical protein
LKGYIGVKFSEPSRLRSDLWRLADRVQAETPLPPVLGKGMIIAGKPGSRRPGIFFHERKVITGKRNRLMLEERAFRPIPRCLLQLRLAAQGQWFDKKTCSI